MFLKFVPLFIVATVTTTLVNSYLTPTRFDIEDVYYGLSAVQNVRLIGALPCKVTGPFALTAALEIANFIVSGLSTKYSVQEIVDCHFGECYERRFSDYVEWLAVNDRLAPVEKYTNYRSKSYTCRAGTAPDALIYIKVVGYRPIKPQDFEAEFMTHGSVLSCIDTSETTCYSYREYRDGIIDGHPSEGCTVKVLIVGYTEMYYRVRTSNGDMWGENGYFRILRGQNRCGIEAHMGVVDTQPRYYKPGLNRYNGCPLKYPNFCRKTKTCRARHQSCLPEVESEVTKSRQKEDEERRRPNAYDFPSKRRRRSTNNMCEDHAGYSCSTLSHQCGYKTIRERCGGTCGVCYPDGTPKCTDTEDYPAECEMLRRYCRRVPAVRIKCQVTCNVDPRDCDQIKGSPVSTIVRYNPPPTGNCYRPTITNGRVLNPRNFLEPQEKLLVRCDRGYTLIGEDSYCEIQNAFKPDTRRLPACIKIGEDDFVGNGVAYSGNRSVTISGQTCENWLASAHRGSFMNVERGLSLLQGGNHNFCRNMGADSVPFCYTKHGQLKEYCFSLPRCGGGPQDQCGVVRTDEFDCSIRHSPAQCVFIDALSVGQKEWIWEHCGAMCCKYAGCQ